MCISSSSNLKKRQSNDYSFHILIYRAALGQTEAAQDQPNVIAHVILVNVHRMQTIFGKNNVPSMTTLHSRENDTNGFLT